MAKEFAKRNPQQLMKVSGKDTFVEVLNNPFEIGKVLFNFAQYDEKAPAGSKIKGQIPMYMDMEEALVFCHDIISGKIPKLAEAEKAKGAKFPKEVYKKQGGTSAARLKASGKERADGGSESRVMKVGPGAVAEFMMTAEKGKGEENATGLIVQRKVEETVRVPFSGEDLKKLALVLQMHIQSYTMARYVDGSAMMNPNNPSNKKVN